MNDIERFADPRCKKENVQEEQVMPLRFMEGSGVGGDGGTTESGSLQA